MSCSEEVALSLRTGYPPANIDAMLRYNSAYLTLLAPSRCTLRTRCLWMRTPLGIAHRLARFQ
jgi:hypothetical protein